MSTYGLGLEILNSVKNSSKRKETADIKKKKKEGRKDWQKLNTGGMKRRLSAHIFDSTIVFSNPIEIEVKGVYPRTECGPSAQGCRAWLSFI